MKALSLFSCLLMASVAFGAPAEDLVTNLPGLNFPTSYTQYSGYLQAAPNRFLHYWFFESINNTYSQPLVLWMNGGPGCSSLLGLFTELGPFYVDQGGSGELHENPYSWSTFSNLLFLEAPTCVGFSYSNDSSCLSSDDSTAEENFAALQDFFTKFPEYQVIDFYVTGESYCGIYIPTLTQLLVDRQSTATVPYTFMGFAIGNGYFDIAANENSLMFFGYYHGVLGDSLWANLTSACCTGPGNQNTCDFYSTTTNNCQLYVDEAYFRMYYNGLNPYNLYSTCGSSSSNIRMKVELSRILKKFKLPPQPQQQMAGASAYSYDPACSDNSPEINYLNQADVKTALHIASEAPTWAPCSNIPYIETYSNTVDKILYVAQATRGLIYNGDVDMVCNFLGNEWDVEGAGLSVVESRRKWLHNGQVAGYVKRFQNLDFLTVKGSGHMVPGYKPAASLHMIEAFILGFDY